MAYDSVARASSSRNFSQSSTQANAAAPSAGRSKKYQIFFRLPRDNRKIVWTDLSLENVLLPTNRKKQDT